MLRALWFFLKLGVLIAIALWLAGQPGDITLHWLDYKVQAALGFVLAALFVFVLVALSLYRLLRAIADIPAFFARRREISRRDKAYQSLTRGLSAVAAGDARTAVKMSRKVQSLIHDHGGLPLLLEAQAAQLEGREDEAQALFLRLSESKDAGFLGVRGLLNAALERGDTARALTFARKGLDMFPRQPWLLEMTLKLETGARAFDDALKTLRKAEKAGSMKAALINSARVAIMHSEAERLAREGHVRQAFYKTKAAYDLDRGFAPSVQRLAEKYMAEGKRRSAVSVLERGWASCPHPDLAPLWQDALPKAHEGSAPRMIAWGQRLTRSHPDHPESLLFMAQIAARCRLWGEARDYLKKLEESGNADRRAYQLWATLEDLHGAGDASLPSGAALTLKAAEAPLPKSWICRETGRVYSRWEPVALPHGAFNTMVWERPGAVLNLAEPESSAPLKKIGVL